MQKRIFSGLIMSIIVIPIIIIGKYPFTIFCGLIGVLALKELIDLKEHHKKIPDAIFIISVINLILLIFSEFDGYSLAFGLSYKYLALLLLSLFLPCLFYQDKNYQTHDAIYLSGSILLLGLVFNSIILIRNYNIYHLFYLLSITITTDIFALISGKLIGKHKIAPLISPNKTWEGSICGTLVATAISSIFYLNLISSANIFKVIIITFILSVIGNLGDLVFSKIKRENKIKDFSNIIPGHGGILDRIDSLVFATLAYIIIFSLI